MQRQFNNFLLSFSQPERTLFGGCSRVTAGHLKGSKFPMRVTHLPGLEFTIVAVLGWALWCGPGIFAWACGAPGADQNLMMACEADDAAGFDRALAEGASVKWRDAYGATALMMSASLGDADQIRRLIFAGADVNAADHQGMTPLMYAAIAQHLDAIRLLLLHGAKPWRRNLWGHSASDLLIGTAQNDPTLLEL
jgi:hypothetical protein